MSKLRDDLRKYEEENNKKFRSHFSYWRCLHCPLSWLSCPLSRHQLTNRTKT